MTGISFAAARRASMFTGAAMALALLAGPIGRVDPVSLRQLRRALRPDGLLLASLFGGETLNELRLSLIEAESELTGGAGPRVAPFADLQDVAGLLQRAGFAIPAGGLP